MLSLLPLARSHATLTYPALMSALDLAAPRALEQLLTTAIYAGLLTATLDPARSVVSVTSVAPLRDLAPGSLPALQATLANWSTRCDSALQDLELRVVELRKAAVEREMMRRKKERALEVMLQMSEDKGKAFGQKRDKGYEDMMDVDEQGESGRQTRGTKRGFAGGFSGLGKRLG
jgi:COP9 signalosome complex subunit 7